MQTGSSVPSLHTETEGTTGAPYPGAASASLKTAAWKLPVMCRTDNWKALLSHS